MMQLTLSRNSLRILETQLENNPSGYTVKQLRMLNRILDGFESYTKAYAEKLNEISTNALKRISEDPKNSTLVMLINEDINQEVDKLLESEGNDIVTVHIEDEYLRFIKEVWENYPPLKGDADARKITIEIDDALQSAKPIEQTN